MSDSNGTFACESCQRQYAWKPELAGRKAKCKCGATIVVPQEPGGDENGLYAFNDGPERGTTSAEDGTSSVRCPHCGQELPGDAVLCVGCGYNFKTGQRMNTRMEDDAAPLPAGVAASAPTAARATTAKGSTRAPAPATPYLGYKQRAPVEDGSSKGKMIGAAIAALLILGGVGTVAWMMQNSGGGNYPAAVTAEDTQTIDDMRRNGTMEAKAFLEAHDSRLLGNRTRNSAFGMIQNMYDMGATEVRVFSNGLIARELIIVLPDDPTGRKNLIAYKNRREEEVGAPLTKDVGQRYLRLGVW